MRRIAAVAVVSIAALVVLSIRYPDLHDRDYGRFADDAAGHGIRNVVSNVGFLLVGLAGLLRIRRNEDDYDAAVTLFAALMLTGAGSAWFHLRPLMGDGRLNRDGLLLDRLPMTIAFAAFLTLVIRDRAIRGRWVLPLTIAAGLGSLAYWYACDRLLPYAFFQGYAAAGTLLMMAVLPASYTEARYVVLAVFFFGLAKLCEAFDQQLFDMFRFGGHPLKHVAGALAALMILLWLRFRRHLVRGGDGALGP